VSGAQAWGVFGVGGRVGLVSQVALQAAGQALAPLRAGNPGLAPQPDAFRAELERRLPAVCGKDPATATARDWYHATAALVREQLAARWVTSRREQDRWQAKRVYYLSMEFLLGRLLTDALRNLGLYEACQAALAGAGHDLEAIAGEEHDAALGNGGLGRLAACLLDSMATLGVAAYGYGLRFEYGLFLQKIENGWQTERPEHWLRHGYPWEFPRTEVVYGIPFRAVADGSGPSSWQGTENVFAVAYDVPICGYGAEQVNTLRLWSAKAQREFDTDRFHAGEHVRALEARTDWENLTRVLYPNDANEAGRRLRFKQEYFFVSASVQDILAQYRAAHVSFDELPERVAIAINDTHPALVVPELMRLLVDAHGVDCARAWELTRRTVSYTNHTLMPEALETWPVQYFETMLPRHLQLIYWINEALLGEARQRDAADGALIERLSLVDERGERRIRMAHLAFAGSHRVNGVSKMHTELMRQTVFADFARLHPDRIVNVTNGVTPRRWLCNANPSLSALISSRIGPQWQGALEHLERLAECADDPQFRHQFRSVKQANKARFARYAAERCGVAADPQSLFDVHIKRIHEYKRQLLKLLHAVTLYDRLRRGATADCVPRSIVFAGKAAPGYAMAKLIVKLIHDVAAVINADRYTCDRLKVLFLPNYSVSDAQIIVPAADLSEQISAAGTEASGTGNMKLALNGALTVGTLDGANVEIAQAVGADNFFAFGLTGEAATRLRAQGHDPRAHYATNTELQTALDMIAGGFFSANEPERFRPIIDSLLGEDRYFVLADYGAYLSCQDAVEALYRDSDAWARRAILNVARAGRLSSDRAVREYAQLVWNAWPQGPSAERPSPST